MLAKLTRGNQLTIPKSIVDKAGLRTGRDFLDVEFIDGIILLKPVDIEDRIPFNTFEKFQDASLKIDKGDIVVAEDQAESTLPRRMKKK